MHKTIQTILLRSSFILQALLALTAVAPAPAKAQSFDTSGTASLSGAYLFRYVDFFNDTVERIDNPIG